MKLRREEVSNKRKRRVQGSIRHSVEVKAVVKIEAAMLLISPELSGLNLSAKENLQAEVTILGCCRSRGRCRGQGRNAVNTPCITTMLVLTLVQRNVRPIRLVIRLATD
jgi:hypothetical protein